MHCILKTLILALKLTEKKLKLEFSSSTVNEITVRTYICKSKLFIKRQLSNSNTSARNRNNISLDHST